VAKNALRLLRWLSKQKAHFRLDTVHQTMKKCFFPAFKTISNKTRLHNEVS